MGWPSCGKISTAEAEALLAQDPQHRDCLFPYLNGEDLNSRPDQSPSRWVINFHDWPLDRSAEECWADADDARRKEWLKAGHVPADYPGSVAADYPLLLAIVEERVKPQRAESKGANYRDRWWRFAESCPGLCASIEGMKRGFGASAHCQAQQYGFLRSRHCIERYDGCACCSRPGYMLGGPE